MTETRIAGIRRLYDLADQFAREVGEMRSQVMIPAINELRYAGHHVLQSISDEGVVDIEKFGQAESHCKRAMYEAAEAGIMFCLDYMKEFNSEFSDLVISEVIEDYQDRRARARQAQELVNQGRSDRISVEDHVPQYMEEFRVVRKAMEYFDLHRDDLNAKRAQATENRRRYEGGRRRDLTRILLIVLAIVVSAVVAILF